MLVSVHRVSTQGMKASIMISLQKLVGSFSDSHHSDRETVGMLNRGSLKLSAEHPIRYYE